MKKINKLSNANVYIDGANMVGRASEVTLPEQNQKMTEHKGLGMIGTTEHPTGLEKMTAKFKWTSFFGDVLRAAGDPRKTHLVQVRGNLETHSGVGLESEVPVVAEIGGKFVKSNHGTFKQHEDVEPESEMSVHYYKLSIDGAVVVEIDVIEGIYKVDGVDILADYRRNLGL